MVARLDALLAVIKPLAGVLPTPAVPPNVLSKVIEPFTLIAPPTAIAPPAEIARMLTPEPAPAELSVIAIREIACLDPVVLLRVKVGLVLAAVTLNTRAVL